MRLIDYACHECSVILEDVYDDEPAPSCGVCASTMSKVFVRPPSVDARSPFKVLSLGGPSFSSYRQMERYAKSTGQVVLPKAEQARRRETTTEERLAKNKPQIQEAYQKAKYRLTHGYQDHPNLPKEKELKRS